MKSIFELCYRYILPAIKGRLVRELYESGLRKTDIAKKLLISHSAVSRYISGERGNLLDLSRFGDVDKMIRRLAVRVRNDKIGFYELNRELYKMTIRILSSKYICSYHGKIDSRVEVGKCNLCSEIFDSRQ